MDRCICIHGHFYQPPRENPWLEDIELQDSAHPFHDWNERITAECYAPNAAARILDGEGYILDIANNYSRISFNFGPTLLSWMERKAPAVYGAILEADRQSRERFGGHGAAIAQAHGHLIMPLCNTRDKRTQVLWGLGDFRHRFGRDPEGMWLPETAVDLETLDILAELGVRFTILSPYQARRVRKVGKHRWIDVTGGRIDPKIAYLCPLPSGRTIHLFFYDGPVARDVAFGGLLRQGENLAHRLVETFTDPQPPHAQLAHIATDGETYGHHHRFGEMALAFCLNYIERQGLARLSVYGEFLEKYPPEWEVEIEENTAWSCAHGVERWRADCGCRLGGNGWQQKWRAPLREAMDWLRDRLAPLYEREMGRLVGDPWRARDEFIDVVLDRSPTNVHRFLRRQAGRELVPGDLTRALMLLEMQRQAMLMYTSCGWFFDEISGIESTQTLAYASRAIQLAERLTGTMLESDFVRHLEKAPSNLPQWRNGAYIYEQAIRPNRLSLIRVAAHHAIASQFQNGEEPGAIYCYMAQHENLHRLRAGRVALSIGCTRIRSEVTWNEGTFTYAVLHLGAQNLNAGVREFREGGAFETMRRELTEAFERSDVPGIIRLMDRHFENSYTLWHLFRDEQRRILTHLMEQTLAEIDASFRLIYEDHFILMRFLQEIGMPIPGQLALPVGFYLNSSLFHAMRQPVPAPTEIRGLGENMRKVGARIDEEAMGLTAGRQIAAQAERLAQEPENPEHRRLLIDLIETCRSLPLPADLWQAQNRFFALYRERWPQLTASAREDFRRLGRLLKVRID